MGGKHEHGCQMAIQMFGLYAFGPSGLKDYGSAMLCCKFCHLATLGKKREHQTSDSVSEWRELKEREGENAAPPIQESALKIGEEQE